MGAAQGCRRGETLHEHAAQSAHGRSRRRRRVPRRSAVKQKDLAAIGDEAFKLYQRLDKDGDHAKASQREGRGRTEGRTSRWRSASATWRTSGTSQVEHPARVVRAHLQPPGLHAEGTRRRRALHRHQLQRRSSSMRRLRRGDAALMKLEHSALRGLLVAGPGRHGLARHGREAEDALRRRERAAQRQGGQGRIGRASTPP